jgi:hypothetical protein
MALCTVLTQQLQVAIRRLGGTIMVLCPITSLAIRCIMMAPRPRPSSESQSGPRSHGANARLARSRCQWDPGTLGVAFRPGPGARLAFSAQQQPRPVQQPGAERGRAPEGHTGVAGAVRVGRGPFLKVVDSVLARQIASRRLRRNKSS